MAAIAPITSLLMPLLRKYLYVTEDAEIHEQLTIAFNHHANHLGDGRWLFYIPVNVAQLEGREYLKWLAMALSLVALQSHCSRFANLLYRSVTGQNTLVDYNPEQNFFRVGVVNAMDEDEQLADGGVIEFIQNAQLRRSNFRLDPAAVQMQVPDAALMPVGVMDIESPVILPREIFYTAPLPMFPVTAPPPPPPAPPAPPVHSISPVGAGTAAVSAPGSARGNGRRQGPPKPPNRWILFLKANYHDVLNRNPGMHTSMICKYTS